MTTAKEVCLMNDAALASLTTRTTATMAIQTPAATSHRAPAPRRTYTAYRAFGLDIASAIPLPELARCDGAARADVVIDLAEPGPLWAELAACGSNFALVRGGGRFMFLIPETAIYCIDEGRAVTVAPLPGADPEKVRVYLLGTCLGALLLLRGLLPLHGSAVDVGGEAHVFVGHSGAGKSTLAAALVGMGYRLLSDDVVAVGTGADGRPLVLPAYPQQKLWRESIDGLGLEDSPLRPLYRETEKFAVPLAGRFDAAPLPLGGIFELTRPGGERIDIMPLSSSERLRIVLEHTYRSALIPRLGLTGWHFGAAARIASQIRAAALSRPAAGFTANAVAAALLSRMKKGEWQ